MRLQNRFTIRAFTGWLLCALAACAPPPGSSPAPEARTLDPDRWVEETLASLSLREKVGQLLMPGTGGNYVALDSPEFERLAQWVDAGIGGISLSIGLPHSYAAKLNALQRRARVPLLVSANMEAGPGERLSGVYALPYLLPQGGGTRFSPVMALGATGSDSLAYELGRVTGREARAVGVHLTFSPTLDVNSNPSNPIINTRSFGEDPDEVVRLGTAFIRGAHSAGLLTAAKHFPGHGDTEVDSHIDLPVIPADRQRLDAVELPPFRAAVDAGVDAIMTAHIAVTGVEGADAPPATLSPYFLTRVLRDEMGFRGLVITDAMEMGAITRRYGDVEALLLAIEAGADVLLKPLDVHRAIEGIEAAVRSGRISEERIDASVRRILTAKARAGLHRGALVDWEAVDTVVGRHAHVRLSEEVAERSITLVRDEASLVPLRSRSGRLLSLTYAASRDLVSGREFDRVLARNGWSVIGARMDDRAAREEWDVLRNRADSADIILVSAYVSPIEHAGSVAAGSELVRFVRDLVAAGRPVVVISFGSPYLLRAFPDVPTYLLAWGGTEAGQRAVARALLGQAPIRGRLPVSLPPTHPLGTGLQRPGVPETPATGGKPPKQP